MADTTDFGRATTDRATVRRWVEERGGRPALGESGVPRIHFPDEEAGGEPVTWRAFFREFERREFAFVYREDDSRWHRFVDRAVVGEV